MNALSIHIPEPCHEDWQQMTPVDKGRFCQSCAKQVVDFSAMTDQEILNYISKASGSMCGRFADDQLQRPLQPIKPEKKKVWWVAAAMPLLMLFEKSAAQQKNTAPTKQITIPLDRTVMGAVSYSDRRASRKNVVNKFTVSRQKGNPYFEISGQITEDIGNDPVPFATVRIKEDGIITEADANGNFTVRGNTAKDHVILNAVAVSFLPRDIYVSFNDTMGAQDNSIYTLHGMLIDADSNEVVPFATVAIKYEKTVTAAGPDGVFKLRYGTTNMQQVLVVSAVSYITKAVPFTLNDKNEIEFDTIRLKRAIPSKDTIVVTAGMTICYRKPSKKDTVPTLIRRIFHAEKFKVSPNPAPRGGSINIDIRTVGSFSIQLFDNYGKLVQVKQFEATEGATQTSINIPSSLAAAEYYIRLVDEKSKTQYTDKIIIE